MGPTISKLVQKIPPARVTMWDSKERGRSLPLLFECEDKTANRNFDKGGRPDLMKLVRYIYRSWGAEVVFITSNYQGNKDLMEGCKKEGIPAFVCIDPPDWRKRLTCCVPRERCGISEVDFSERGNIACKGVADWESRTGGGGPAGGLKLFLYYGSNTLAC